MTCPIKVGLGDRLPAQHQQRSNARETGKAEAKRQDHTRGQTMTSPAIDFAHRGAHGASPVRHVITAKIAAAARPKEQRGSEAMREVIEQQIDRDLLVLHPTKAIGSMTSATI